MLRSCIKMKLFQIGTVRCDPDLDSLRPWPVHSDHSVWTHEVAAGRWTSRFLSDSVSGMNLLCHTLEPNVSADFYAAGGAEARLVLSEPVRRRLPRWHLHVHESGEVVLPDAYGMAGEEGSLLRMSASPPNGTLLLKRASISVRHHRRPASMGGCVDEGHGDDHGQGGGDQGGYGQNLCEIRRRWDLRMKAVS